MGRQGGRSPFSSLLSNTRTRTFSAVRSLYDGFLNFPFYRSRARAHARAHTHTHACTHAHAHSHSGTGTGKGKINVPKARAREPLKTRVSPYVFTHPLPIFSPMFHAPSFCSLHFHALTFSSPPTRARARASLIVALPRRFGRAIRLIVAMQAN